MDHLLSAVSCSEDKWLICGDLNVVGLVLGLQGEYTKYSCFLWVRDSCVDYQYVRQEWLLRQRFKLGLHFVESHPLVELNKTLFPPLHIQLGVKKNFVKASDRKGSGLAFSQKMFPLISMQKLKADISDSP